jgi:hypothetical protein
MAYYMKFSMHVRLTNCVRKNAWYELDSAVALTRLLGPIMSELATRHPGFALMPEPSATSLDLSALGTLEEAREVSECFGIIYRKNLAAGDREQYQPQVAMALFAWDKQDRSVCCRLIQRYADNMGFTIEQATLNLRWPVAWRRVVLPVPSGRGAGTAFAEHGHWFREKRIAYPGLDPRFGRYQVGP